MKIELINDRFAPSGHGPERSRGIHLTNVIRHIRETMEGGPRPKGFDDIYATREMGFIWEDVLGTTLGSRMGARPGEVELDGIIGSPDGVALLGDEFVVEEYKCTWRSCNKLPTEDWYWMTQIEGYCKMLGTLVCVMKILYLMGNYKGSGPLYKEYRITFDQVEVDDNWVMILNHKAGAEDINDNEGEQSGQNQHIGANGETGIC